MSRSKRRASRRYTPPKHTGPIATTFAVVLDPADIETAKQATHDQLIIELGDLRRSGVSWTITTGEHAVEFLRLERLHAEPSKSYDRDHYHAKAAALIAMGGTLVVAAAEAAS